MTSFPSRVLPAAMLVGSIAACAPAKTDRAPSPPSPTTVTSDEIARQPAASLEQLLAGRVAGVQVARAPGGGISVQIRGPSSFVLSNEPLFVVDGVPIAPGPGGTLSWLNPHDIASIEVLKDAASLAMYGVRGGNGVIVIKTKRSDQ